MHQKPCISILSILIGTSSCNLQFWMAELITAQLRDFHMVAHTASLSSLLDLPHYAKLQCFNTCIRLMELPIQPSATVVLTVAYLKLHTATWCTYQTAQLGYLGFITCLLDWRDQPIGITLGKMSFSRIIATAPWSWSWSWNSHDPVMSVDLL